MNMNQIAKLAGVSAATVSRAFSAPHKVRPALRVRVLAIAEQHNYVYNASAADLQRRVSQTVGMLFPQRIGAVFSKTFMAVQETLLEHGLAVIVGHTRYDRDIETGLVRRFLERQVAGIIFTGFTLGQETLIQELGDKGITTVVTWETLAGSGLNYVGIDNHQAAFRATQYLISLGHRRIGLLVGPYTKLSRIQKRYRGYRDALNANGIEPDPKLVVATELGLWEGREAMGRLLAVPECPTAVLAASDYLAMGALRAIKEAGLKVPEQISLMGLDDAEFAAYCDPPLTTIRFPARQIGLRAAEIFLARQQNRNTPPLQYCLDADLIVRETCAPPGRQSRQ